MNKKSFSEVSNASRIKEHFINFLTTAWLRPERALLDAYMVSVMEPFIKDIEGASLDWGCTDGSLSFALLGGVFNFEYDDYLEVELQNNLKDIGSKKNVDFFDKCSIISVSPIAKNVAKGFTHGVSWKESHIDKARRFEIHESLIAQDFAVKLPFPENYFSFIFASNLFWIEPRDVLKRVLNDLILVSKKGGKILTLFPKKDAPLSIAQHLEGADAKWVNMIDRGISANLLLNAMTLEESADLFSCCGWRITTVVEFCPSLISTVYQIGFRPMFPVFMNMYEKLKKVSPDKFVEIKKQWIETVSDFMIPLCENEWMDEMGMSTTWYCFELEKI